MEKTLLGVLCLAVIVIVVIGSVSVWRTRRGHESHSTTRIVCIKCQGSGTVVSQVRTLEFDGTGFVDETSRTRPCSACGGTGFVAKSL